MKKTMGIVAAGAVVLVGLALLLQVVSEPALQGDETDELAAHTGEVADFSFQTYSGESFSLAEQRGKVVVVRFWASLCGPCKEEAPSLERAWRAYKDRGVVFVGVNTWDRESDARAFIQKNDITYVNGPDPIGQIAINHRVTGLPETWFINRQGKLIHRWFGAITEQRLLAYTDGVLRQIWAIERPTRLPIIRTPLVQLTISPNKC